MMTEYVRGVDHINLFWIVLRNLGQKRKKFRSLLNEYKKNDYYDCIVPVSGGKDSYYQTHVICKNII